MKLYWKQAVSTVMIASSVVLAVSPAFADAAVPVPTVVASPTYSITDMTQAQVKNVLLEKTAGGWRIGSVIKLSNSSGAIVRIPDFELRAKAADGTSYTLQPSAANAKSISPQSNVELSYMTEIDAKNEISLTDLIWVDVNMNVYPKQETVLADAGIGSIVWKGSDAVIDDASLLSWGQSFTLPEITSSLTYSAVSLSTQFTEQKPTYVVQLKVNNSSSFTETVPDFTLSGKVSGQSFVGKRVEQKPISVNPRESQYLYYTISTDAGIKPEAFYVLTPESFLKQGQTTPQSYYTGRIGFHLPTEDANVVSLPAYQMGTPITIDAVSQAVNPKLAVSLVRADWYENEGQSYKTVVANLKYMNNSDSPLPIPALGTELVNSSGTAYTGNVLPSTIKEVLPGMGVSVAYAFTMPISEEAESFNFKLQELQGESGFKASIAQLNVAVQKTVPNDTELNLYPYNVKLNSWALSMVISQNASTKDYNYTYKLKTLMDINTTDNVVTEESNPKLLIELDNPAGERIAFKTLLLSGPDRIMSGNQNIYFTNGSSDQMESPLKLKIYETITTPIGEARRLLSSLTQ
ncbi:hypothetical protein OB236_31700 [Paenibacillus sp. WQ 127069]|uniref:DUF4179 domain-containing protein n=1 Tax=Paenibacillus baimaensis TaxID=2982185 RepID=A0ABT2URM6_9BACL|nr:hypothetical protein [Paenibacillus sp. WQ 127069]MCU6796701.1 hypothetical protein [Paenibacillus sp. WQ 127069]